MSLLVGPAVPRRLSRVAHDEAARVGARDQCGAVCGSGALVDVPHQGAWRKILPRLPLVPGDRILMTGADEDHAPWAATAGSLGHAVFGMGAGGGAGRGLSALTHLLWWDPSVRAVFVAHDESSDVAPDVAEVRRAIELTGSDALLLVDASAWRGLDGLDRVTRSADLVVAALGPGSEDRRPASLVAWSPRLAPGLSLLDGLQPLSYDVLARLHSELP